MLNQVQLIGFTGAEAEFRTTQGGKKVATLRVCTSRYTKKNVERKDYPTWHQVEIWNQPTVNWLASKGLAKGAKVFVQGEIRQDRYTDKDGVERFFAVARFGDDRDVTFYFQQSGECPQDHGLIFGQDYADCFAGVFGWVHLSVVRIYIFTHGLRKIF